LWGESPHYKTGRGEERNMSDFLNLITKGRGGEEGPNRKAADEGFRVDESRDKKGGRGRRAL